MDDRHRQILNDILTGKHRPIVGRMLLMLATGLGYEETRKVVELALEYREELGLAQPMAGLKL
jgi:hypothetical protein